MNAYTGMFLVDVKAVGSGVNGGLVRCWARDIAFRKTAGCPGTDPQWFLLLRGDVVAEIAEEEVERVTTLLNERLGGRDE